MLEIDQLSFSIGDAQILQGVSFSLKEGERVGIIGPNGSGKTTLFNCLSGFYTPKSGRVSFRGQDITTLRPFKRAELGLGRVFQNFGIFKEMTVLENVVLALETRGSSGIFPWSQKRKEIEAQALSFLDEVGLTDKAKSKAGSLSGGQMRLLEIIRTLAFGAELFLLDEPTAGVSPKMKGDVDKLLRKLAELGKTVLIIEHDLNFIESLCERIVVLDLGSVVIDGTPNEVRSDERLYEIYFGQTAEHS